jgi:micrococcal nuclease
MYEYACIIKRVVDGDTVDIDIDLGFNIWVHNERIRFIGIDTPELRTRDKTEKIFGLYAKTYVENILPVGSKQILKTVKDEGGKYGRILGDFLLDGEKSLVEKMIADKVGVPYLAQNKSLIQNLHLENRKFLIENGMVSLNS